ncbi:MAG: hypothetical protein AAFW89_05460 [Bacteroidota bacterium]
MGYSTWCLAIFLVIAGCSTSPKEPVPLPYLLLNEAKPDTIPAVFAPGFISMPDRYEFGITISRDGNEIFFGVDPIFDLQTPGVHQIWRSSFEQGEWSEPRIFLSHPEFTRNDPMFSNDDQRLYFISNQPLKGNEKKDIDLWYIQNEGGTWSEPINAGHTINSEFDEFYSSFTTDGSMYFASNAGKFDSTRSRNYNIYKARFDDGEYKEPIALSDSINTGYYEGDVFVAPDESYLIFAAGRRGGLGRGDLYISFKNKAGTWTKAKNMGELINSEHHELCPYVSPDGKTFFYTSNKELLWVSTEIFERYR